MLKLKPKLHIFGHIHGGHGKAISASETQFVNASVLNEAYRLVHEAQVVEIETHTIARTSCPALRD